MTAHHTREHAVWSASASDRLWACPGALTLCEGLPDHETEAAAWGTACHQVSEKCLRLDKDAVAFLGTTETTKERRFVVDDEMAECAQMYVDYVRSRRDAPGRHEMLIEQKFLLDALNPPLPAGGTGDTVILSPDDRRIEVVDLKTGWGQVEVRENKQLRTYALGALLANPGDWRVVRVTIVQPRAPHADGPIRSEEFHAADIFDWTADLLDAMARAKGARDGFASHGAGPDWARDNLSAGPHCTFCKARATCPALARKALAEAHTFFADEASSAPKMPPAPQMLSTEQLVRVLDHADMIENWLKAVRAYAKEQAEAGFDVTDGQSTYVLVPGRNTRKWTTEDPLPELGRLTGRDAADFFQEPRMMSPNMVEKMLGKKGYEAVKGLVKQEPSGFNLVRSDKTTRAAVAPAKQFFQIEG